MQKRKGKAELVGNHLEGLPLAEGDKDLKTKMG